GAAPKVSSVIDKSGNSLESRINEIGFGAVTREDDVYLIGATRIRQLEAKKTSLPLVAGTDLRDWTEPDSTIAIWPYDSETLKAKLTTSTRNHLWRYRTNRSSRSAYGSTQIVRGLSWFEYSMFFNKRFAIPCSIAFAFVATHNHFVLDRGGKVFKQSAPVIKLPEGASED